MQPEHDRHRVSAAEWERLKREARDRAQRRVRAPSTSSVDREPEAGTHGTKVPGALGLHPRVSTP